MSDVKAVGGDKCEAPYQERKVRVDNVLYEPMMIEIVRAASHVATMLTGSGSAEQTSMVNAAAKFLEAAFKGNTPSV